MEPEERLNKLVAATFREWHARNEAEPIGTHKPLTDEEREKYGAVLKEVLELMESLGREMDPNVLRFMETNGLMRAEPEAVDDGNQRAPTKKVSLILAHELSGLIHEIGPIMAFYDYVPSVQFSDSMEAIRDVVSDLSGEKALLLIDEEQMATLASDDLASLAKSHENLHIVWVDFEPELCIAACSSIDAEDDVLSADQALVLARALGEDASSFSSLVAAIDQKLMPDFDPVTLEAGRLSCYQEETDTELHLDLLEAREQFRQGALDTWLDNQVPWSDAPN